MRIWRTFFVAALCWLAAAGTGWTQAVAGSQVSGVVKDSSGGVLPGVEVTMIKTDTAEVGGVVSRDFLADTPIFDRNFMTLAGLIPGLPDEPQQVPRFRKSAQRWAEEA